MRRSLWFLSAPVVAGGLVWSVNATHNPGSLMAGAPQGKNGQIVYFSRSGKPAPASVASDSAVEDATADDAVDDSDVPQPAQRYVRNKPPAAASKAGASGVKNYRQLFANGDAATGSPATAGTAASQPVAPQAASRTRPKSAQPAAQTPPSDPPAEDSQPAASDASDQSDDVQLAEGSRDEANIRQADVKPSEEKAKNSVRMVQFNQRRTPSPQVAPAGPPADDDEPVAPVAVPAAASAAAKSERAANGKPAAGRPQAVKSGNGKAASMSRGNSKQAAVASSKPQAKVSQVSAEEPAPAPRSTGVTFAAAANDDAAMVSLRWSKIDEINVNQECKCGLLVKNTGKTAAKDIVVEAFFPRSVRLIDAEPFPSDTKDHLVWVFEHLDAGEEKAIEITMVPGRRGELATNATVRFTGVATSVVRVEEPALSMAISGPQEATVGESLTQIITVSNPGTGVVHDIVVHAKVPEGLEHPRGKVVEMGIGSLGAGETRELRLPLTAVSGGECTLLIEAHGGSNLSQNVQSLIKIAAPKLGVEVAGPSKRYVGRQAQYVSTVTNEGIAATDNVRVVHLVPEGFEFKRADKGGKFDAATGSVSWFIGRLEAGESIQVACELKSKQIGEFLHHVQVSGEGGTAANSQVTTRIDGSSKVTMEVADTDDPVEIETQTAYEIRIRNDGSIAAQGVKIVCELPAGVELIDTNGPTAHVVEKGELHFKPIAELAPGAKATYVIRVNGKQAGNLRMRARLTSSASPEPVVVEEVTKFYAD